ncbi:MAG: glycoside hydrolase family 13 protein [Parabacteroides sp.]|nr:glycoside hydrolase family 13 protein [Parabacteroides sp.]
MQHEFSTPGISRTCGRILCIAAVLTVFCVSLRATDIRKIQPAFWWAGIDSTPLQVLLYGDRLADAEPSLSTGAVSIRETVRFANPDYLILYLDIQGAAPQTFDILLKKGKHTERVPYELRPRRTGTDYAQGFDAGDVVYLLMPDRFANGNPDNDTVAGLLEKTADRTRPDSRHGGDLEGVMQHLDYFSRLGVTALWMTPVLENDMPGGSYHGYAVTDYYRIDPRFGSNETYRQLVEQAHGKGIKVIMDMVFNHCGSENFLFKDMPDADWFNHGKQYVQTNYETLAPSDVHAADTIRALAVNGWFTECMPDWNQCNRYVADYLIQNSIWWVEYAGIDGIRQDTHPYIDSAMSARWCNTLSALYPRFNIVGEAWTGNNVSVAYWQKNSWVPDAFNSGLPTVMDFPLMDILNRVATDGQGLYPVYSYLAQDAVYADPMRLLTFLDNHDTSRFCRNEKEASDRNRFRQAMTLLLTLRGIPQLYYGTEIMESGDKAQGDGLLRKDFPGGWAGDTTNVFTGTNLQPRQQEAFRFTQKLLQWRRGNEVIARGSLKHFPPVNGVYVYERKYNGRPVVVMLNGTACGQTLPLGLYREILPAKAAHDVLTGTDITLDGTLSFPPYGIYLLEF